MPVPLYQDGETQGYLVRAIVAWVTAPLSEFKEVDIINQIDEVRTIAQTCYRRGAAEKPLMFLLDHAIRRLCRFKHMDNDGRIEKKALPIHRLSES